MSFSWRGRLARAFAAQAADARARRPCHDGSAHVAEFFVAGFATDRILIPSLAGLVGTSGTDLSASGSGCNMSEATAARFSCGGCNKTYAWKPELAGKRVKCKCGQVIDVPQATAQDEDEAMYDLAPSEEPVKPKRPVMRSVPPVAVASPAAQTRQRRTGVSIRTHLARSHERFNAHGHEARCVRSRGAACRRRDPVHRLLCVSISPDRIWHRRDGHRAAHTDRAQGGADDRFRAGVGHAAGRELRRNLEPRHSSSVRSRSFAMGSPHGSTLASPR